jgi:hypothetical protein
MQRINNIINSPFEQWNNILITLDYETPEILPKDPKILKELSIQKQKKRNIFCDSLCESIFEDFDSLTLKGTAKEEPLLTPYFRKFFLMLHIKGSKQLEPYLFSLLDLLSLDAFEGKKLGYILGSLLMHLDTNALMMSNNLITKDLKSGNPNRIILALNLVNQCGDAQLIQACLPLISPFLMSHQKNFKVDYLQT